MLRKGWGFVAQHGWLLVEALAVDFMGEDLAGFSIEDFFVVAGGFLAGDGDDGFVFVDFGVGGEFEGDVVGVEEVLGVADGFQFGLPEFFSGGEIDGDNGAAAGDQGEVGEVEDVFVISEGG